MTASLDTLFLALENIPAGGPTLFIGAAGHPGLRNLKPDVWQPFKPLADGVALRPNLAELPKLSTYDSVLVNVPKQVEEAKFWIASGLYALKENGWLLLAAANDANGNRIEKWMKELGLAYGSLSKNKARAVWVQRPAHLPDRAHQWHVQGQKQKVQIGDGTVFMSQPGLYGWDKIDAGSRLLTHHLPNDVKGIGADFGAGTGYLSYHLLKNYPGIATLYLAEADSRALDCAKENMESVRGNRLVEFVWADLTKPGPFPALDFIVMNPPFHAGKKTDAGIGQAFIATASHHLKKNGRLFMVANAQLPYEQILREKFTRFDQIAADNGFKILEAIK